MGFPGYIITIASNLKSFSIVIRYQMLIIVIDRLIIMIYVFKGADSKNCVRFKWGVKENPTFRYSQFIVNKAIFKKSNQDKILLKRRLITKLTAKWNPKMAIKSENATRLQRKQ